MGVKGFNYTTYYLNSTPRHSGRVVHRQWCIASVYRLPVDTPLCCSLVKGQSRLLRPQVRIYGLLSTWLALFLLKKSLSSLDCLLCMTLPITKIIENQLASPHIRQTVQGPPASLILQLDAVFQVYYILTWFSHLRWMPGTWNFCTGPSTAFTAALSRELADFES